MEKTRLLFYEDAYLQSCESQVVSFVPVNDNFVGLILTKTCFFPHSGGASGDTGRINDMQTFEAILDTTNHIVIHPISIEEQTKFCIHKPVSCRIDWARRYMIMRLHSASHIMEHFLFSLVPQIKLLGTNVNEERDSSTYETQERIPDQIIDQLNRLTNEFIGGSHEIRTYPDNINVSRRVWECHGIILSCGGVHPRNTQEIGAVLIKRKGGSNRQRIRTELCEP